MYMYCLILVERSASLSQSFCKTIIKCYGNNIKTYLKLYLF